MGRFRIGIILKLTTMILVGGTMMATYISLHNGIKKESRRQLLQASTPLPVSASVCGGLGPVCPEGVHIECTVGGIVGCICSLVHTCQPNVAGCTLYDGTTAIPCGF